MNGHVPIATWPIPRQLPGDVGTFVGRARMLERLDTLLAGPEARTTAVISAVAGTAGVGKTALALRWAHRVRARFPDGDLFANLHGYDSGPRLTATEVLDGFLRAMDVPASRIPTTLDAQAGLYRSILRERRVLVVLDNAASTEDVRPLLPGSPTCLVLVTSRSRLSGLVAREGASRVTLDMLPRDEAVELLREVVGAERTDAEPAELAELAALCGYLPLALRIAAERILTHPQWTLADLVADLADERDRLDTLSTSDDETTAVRAVFSWSYRALAPDTARMFRLLGLHQGAEISTDVAASLAGSRLTVARRQLDVLAGLHLVEEVSRDRYRFHDLLRVYAADRAEQDEPQDERREATQRMLSWYLHAAEAADRTLSPHRERVPLERPTRQPPSFPDYDHAWDWCETERPNLVAAIRQADEIGESDLAWRMPGAMLTYFTHRKPRADWLVSHQVGLRASRRAGDRYGEAWMLTSLSLAHRELRQFDEAMACLREALPLWRQVGVRWAEGWVLFDIGFLHHERRDHVEALDYLQRALEVRRDAGDQWGEGSTLALLGEVLHRLGRLDEAADHAERSLDLQRATDNQRGMASAMHTLGLIHHDLGQVDAGLARLGEALALRREAHNHLGEAKTLRVMGDLERRRGDLDAARRNWRRALEILERLEDPEAAEVRADLARA